jgi:hypothetical protein
MSKKIQLSVPIPCHEDWDAMTPVDKGKFCGSCQKQVVDFSNMSDREVAVFFKKPSTGSVCGRFMNDQLDRDMEIPGKRIPWVKYFFQFALPAFLFSMKATAQGMVKVNVSTAGTTKTPFSKQIIKLGQVKKPVCIKPLIRGAVIASPKPDSNLTITGEIKNEIQKTNIEITKVFNDTTTLPEVVLTSYNVERKGKVMVGGAVAIVRRSTKDVPLMENLISSGSNSIKIFPNPARSGTSINIEWKQSETGYYLLQLLNPSGQLVFTKEIWIDEEARVLNLPLPPVAAGTYFLRMTNKKTGKGYTEKVIIQ